MPLWTELLRSVPLPTASLFLKKRDIANGSVHNCIDTGDFPVRAELVEA